MKVSKSFSTYCKSFLSFYCQICMFFRLKKTCIHINLKFEYVFHLHFCMPFKSPYFLTSLEFAKCMGKLFEQWKAVYGIYGFLNSALEWPILEWIRPNF